MCRPTDTLKTVAKDGTENEQTNRIILKIIDAIIAMYTVGFAFFRTGELIPLAASFPRQFTATFLGTCALHASSSISRGSKRLIHVLTICFLIYIMDSFVPRTLPSAADVRSSEWNPKTIVITGANSGVGFETARQLAVNYGMKVIMGCRSQARCEKASNAINSEITALKTPSGGVATPYIIDLADFDSVKSFASDLKKKRIHVDVLFNNAGYVPEPNQPVNKYGLDPGFTSMHLSHFLLTELLIESNPTLRVVNTSSGTHHLCALPFAIVPRSILGLFHLPQNPGCVDENFLENGMYAETDAAAYIQSKIANVMHISEIPRVHKQSTAIAIDLGWVGTSIQPFMTGSLTPTSMGWMRSAQAGVLPMLHAILSRKEDLMKELDPKMEQKEGGIVMNVFGRPEETFSYSWWTSDGASGYDLGHERMESLARSLWMKSMDVLKQRKLV